MPFLYRFHREGATKAHFYSLPKLLLLHHLSGLYTLTKLWYGQFEMRRVLFLFFVCLYAAVISNVQLQQTNFLSPTCQNCLVNSSKHLSTTKRKKLKKHKPVSNAEVTGLKPRMLNETLIGKNKQSRLRVFSPRCQWWLEVPGLFGRQG